jgi:hypothetical protein
VDKVTLLLLVVPLIHFICAFPFCNLLVFEINLDTLVPSYIADDDVLLYLASIVLEQSDRTGSSFVGPLLPPTGLPLVPYSDSDDEDGDVVEIQGPFTSSKKRRARKMKEPLEASFLRLHLNPDLGGFRNSSNAREASIYAPLASPVCADALVPISSSPLYVGVPAGATSSAAPMLSLSIIQGMATEFLKMPPEAVSVAFLLELDEDVEA